MPTHGSLDDGSPKEAVTLATSHSEVSHTGMYLKGMLDRGFSQLAGPGQHKGDVVRLFFVTDPVVDGGSHEFGDFG